MAVASMPKGGSNAHCATRRSLPYCAARCRSPLAVFIAWAFVSLSTPSGTAAVRKLLAARFFKSRWERVGNVSPVVAEDPRSAQSDTIMRMADSANTSDADAELGLR